MFANAPNSNSVKPDIAIDSQPEYQETNLPIEGLSHKQMKQLTDLSISSIRSKASRGILVIAKDGFTYSYDKNPQILKWIRIS